MSKLNENDFIRMAKKIHIKPNDNVLKYLQKEYEQIDIMLMELKKIDVTNIEPLTRISQPISLLREDIADETIVLDKNVALSNAAEKNDNYVIIKRILK